VTDEARPRAIAVGVQLPGVSDEEHAASLAELARLAKTLGYDVRARLAQKRAALAKGAVIGEGKLEELVRLAGDADAVLVDHELTPSQARNLEKATGKEVLDRTAVILAIFHRHARSREARLQVEIARLAYLAPRLRESSVGRDRQGGGIGSRGAGESHLELDRRKLRDRMAELRRELASIAHESGTRRKRRSQQPTAALVGYTNAGKSSLMRALTGSAVQVADRLFATLDTTVRALDPPTQPRILISDTVGFIKKLPHDLVASFRSTLEEAQEADLQLHVVDASDPAMRAQLEVTRQVLREIGADGVPVQLVLNKRDRLAPEQEAALKAEFPDAILVSAKRPEDVARLHACILAFFERDMEETELLVPYTRQRVLADIHGSCRVLSESHDERGTLVRLRARPEQLARLRAVL
jgi:GTP-binding protein HflX